VVVGLRRDGEYKRWLYKNGFRQSAPTISPYLVASSRRTIVAATRRPPGGLPEMVFGPGLSTREPYFTPEQRRTLLETYPEAGGYLRRFIGATEFLGNVDRYILFLGDDQVDEACRIPEVERRLNAVRDERLRSKKPGRASWRPRLTTITPRATKRARQFSFPGIRRRTGLHSDRVSGAETIVSDAANAIYDAPPWLFALLTSRMHNVWARAVCGRIKTDFRYSATLCYNTFPVPALSDKSRGLLTERAFAVLAAREQHSDKTLAQLYDLGKMPRSCARRISSLTPQLTSCIATVRSSQTMSDWSCCLTCTRLRQTAPTSSRKNSRWRQCLTWSRHLRPHGTEHKDQRARHA